VKNNFVKDWMTSKPVLIASDATLPEAHKLMKDSNVRRLPVVDNGKQVGIVTWGDVLEAGPSDAISLSIYELNYLIARLKVKEIMSKDVITVVEDTKLHDVAKLMLEKKIGGLPVMNGDKVVGIITESDVFRAVMEISK
jgi:CBS domain-containing protein